MKSNPVTDYLASIGSKGGKSKSPAKLKAVNLNLQKAWKARAKKSNPVDK